MRRLAFTITLAVATLGDAQVSLLPLDSRPATSDLPARIAALSGVTVRLPGSELLGNATRGAEPGVLGAWLTQQGEGALVVALDALAYGGLVQSRTSSVSADEAVRRLEPVRAWAEQGRPVYAFVTLPREPDATNRTRNLEVARRMIDWARVGVFRELHVTWDDARPGSPAPREGAELRRNAPANVRVYPGADEVLASLVARALTPEARRLAVEYSDPGRAERVAAYEGVPLTESVRLHAEAAGWTLVPTRPTRALTPFGGVVAEPTEPSELFLYVYNGGNTRQAALRVSQLARQGRVAVADVDSVNTGTLPVWSDLTVLDRPRVLASLAAWGTPGNNIGTALAHAKVLLGATDAHASLRQDELLARQYANDVIYSARVRSELRKLIPESRLNQPEASAVLTELARKYFPIRLGRVYLLQDAVLPWGRSFEWRFELTPAP